MDIYLESTIGMLFDFVFIEIISLNFNDFEI